MNYYLDTEFHEYEKRTGTFKKAIIPTIDLISIGIVAEDGREYYAICKDFDVKAAWKNDWLQNNVLLPIYIEHIHGDMRNHVPFSIGSIKGILKGFGKSREEIKKEVIDFCNHWHALDNPKIRRNNIVPKFYAYYADYDWVVFCWLFGRMIDLPKSFPMYCIDLKQIMDEKLSGNMTREGQTLEPRELVELRALSGLKERLEWLSKHSREFPVQKNEHNALADAKWNKRLHEFLNKL